MRRSSCSSASSSFSRTSGSTWWARSPTPTSPAPGRSRPRQKKTELAVTEQALMELSMQNKHLAELRDGAADETMDEAPSKLSVRSESLLAAKELLSLNYEKKYDRRNHTEAVAKLSAMFHTEIEGLHANPPSKN
mmetsp:Transcript_60826/g.139062  ORF Transcript_60826/g.139062 Transcript_60826/m.139062 type:complete len:135 (+) Transcript_60826:1032-1436(+)